MRVPTPYSNLDTTAFALKSKNISIKSKEDLKKYKIVVIRGVQHTYDITKGMPDVSLIDDCESMIKFLESNRADVALTNSLNGISVLNKSKRHNIEIVGHLEKLDLYHYINSKYAQLIAKIDTIIQDMDRSGELTRLRSQFENEYLMNQLEHSKP
jgi:ABC-type amino acid transport substrate-binding protein